MLVDTLRDLTRSIPFKPFRLYVSTGDVFEVRHPEMLIASDEAVVIALPAPEGPSNAAQRIQIVSMMHIQKFDFLPEAVSSKTESNGTH